MSDQISEWLSKSDQFSPASKSMSDAMIQCGATALSQMEGVSLEFDKAGINLKRLFRAHARVAILAALEQAHREGRVLAAQTEIAADATRPPNKDLVKAARELLKKWQKNPRAVGDADFIDLHAALKVTE